MRFPYRQIEEDTIEPAGGSIQVEAGHGASNDVLRNSDLEDVSPTFKQLLPHWPFITGIFQIFVGFLCGIFGAVAVFVLPFQINVEAELGLNEYNFYGAALWSGLLLVISGSLAVRTSKIRSLVSVQQFYVISLFSFLSNFSFLILILWCYMDMLLNGYFWSMLTIESAGRDAYDLIPECYKAKDKIPDYAKQFCDEYDKLKECSTVHLISAVFSLLGCHLLFLSVINYTRHVLFGEVNLLKSLAVCWLPCWFYSPPSQANSYQSVESDYSMQNAII
ncbi:hypothetical protein ACF0H5_022854 [Mactra antiquata]